MVVRQEAEARIRKQSNSEITYIATNPFKLVVSHKSADRDEWAQMNSAQAKRGILPDIILGCAGIWVYVLSIASVGYHEPSGNRH